MKVCCWKIFFSPRNSIYRLIHQLYTSIYSLYTTIYNSKYNIQVQIFGSTDMEIQHIKLDTVQNMLDTCLVQQYTLSVYQIVKRNGAKAHLGPLQNFVEKGSGWGFGGNRPKALRISSSYALKLGLNPYFGRFL